MIRLLQDIPQMLRAFGRDESGVASIQFVIAFPVFMLFFGMTFENGMISARHVMLERGVDIAVRDVRVGRMPDPTPALLRARICEAALIIPNCESQLQLEMVTMDLRNWTAAPTQVQCIDRGTPDRPLTTFTPGGNNQLVYLRACARFDPVMPTTGIGYAITNGGGGSSAGGSYALIATAAYVVEPFQRNAPGTGTGTGS